MKIEYTEKDQMDSRNNWQALTVTVPADISKN
jgi:hypothetical protein